MGLSRYFFFLCVVCVCVCAESCRGFEHSYTFVLGSINDSDTDRK